MLVIVCHPFHFKAFQRTANAFERSIYTRNHRATRAPVIQRLPKLLSSFSLAGVRIVAMTFHPFAENNFVVAFPNPLEAPVMNIVFIFFPSWGTLS
jgi:hypothetical protein